MRFLRPRFSLRTLLILTAVAAAACYWWFARPTVLAIRFARAIEAKDYTAADALCIDPNRRFVNRVVYEFVTGGESISGTTVGTLSPFSLDTELLPQSWQDILRGTRRLELRIRHQSNPDNATGPLRVNTFISRRVETWPLTARSSGIYPPRDATPTWVGNINLPVNQPGD